MTTVEQSSSCSELAMTGNADQETAPLILCNVCGAEPRDRDRFCRQCGASQASQSGRNVELNTRATAAASLIRCNSHSTPGTAPLAQADTFHRVSGSLVAAVANGALANTATYPINRVTRKVVAVLISIPIWLLIILLSPLDAYTAARAVTRQV